jgi:hypothetical protein
VGYSTEVWWKLPDVLEALIAFSIAVMMEAVSCSVTPLYIYQTTWCNIPEESYLHTRRRVNVTAINFVQNYNRPTFQKYELLPSWRLN